MNPIAQERCFNHRRREAVARCPECHRCFCRECITEHGNRVICAACLQNLAIRPTRQVAYNRCLVLMVNSIISFLMLWFVFQAIGRGLLRLPSSFHEGTLWRAAP